MASGSKSGAAGIQNDLMTITEGVTSRDQSPSPKFYDCISPEIHPLNTDISDFEPSSQVLEKTPGPQNFSGGSPSKKAFSRNKSLSHLPSCATATIPTKQPIRSWPSSSQPKADKRAPENIDPLKKQPKRHSTNITNASASLEETEDWDRKSILSLDGGGIRGYSALLVLRELMRVIGTLESNHSDGAADSSFHPLTPAPNIATDTASMSSKTLCDSPKTDSSSWLPCHYFDYIAGTSTGGLIGIMLGRLRMSIDDCIRDYENFGDRVFGHARWFHLRSPLFWPRDKYNHEVLEKVVKEVVENRVPYVAGFPGGRNFAFDENRCRTVVLSYQKQKTKGVEKTYLFRTYKNLHRGADSTERLLDRNPGQAQDIPIWEVARATSAAPTYFQPIKINEYEYLDGGFGANNPCVEIYDEVRKMNNNSDDFATIIISVGTGKNKNSRFIDGSGISRYLNYFNFAKKWASNSEVTHEDMLKKKKSRVSKLPYFRFNVDDGLDTMKLDEWRVRGPVRTTLGQILGARSAKQQALPFEHPIKGKKNEDESFRQEKKSDTSNSQASTPRPRIPTWLQPRNKTLESIVKYTKAYLAQDDVKETIEECAKLLVENRRLRARKDPQRWEKACFAAWYQCNIDGCRRAEKEYESRDALERHLRDKHRSDFPIPAEESNKSEKDRIHAKLKKKLDECKIVVH